MNEVVTEIRAEYGNAQRLTIYRINICYSQIAMQNVCICYMAVFTKY
jgi:hypothetical protein